MWATNVAWLDTAAEEDVFEAHDRMLDLLIELGVDFDTITTVWLPPEEDKQ